MLAILSAFSLWVFAGEWINPTTVILAVDRFAGPLANPGLG